MSTKEKGIASSNTVAILVAIIGALATIIVALLAIFKEPLVAGLTSPDLKALAIEEIPQEIFAYADNSPGGGWSTFWVIYADNNIPVYKLDYFLPNDKDGYAGLAFQFGEGSNLSTYNTVECVIIFSQLSDVVDLYFKDIASNFNTIRVANNGANEMLLRYEFTNFPSINFNAVKEFGIVVSTDFSTGGHQVRIKNVRFAK